MLVNNSINPGSWTGDPTPTGPGKTAPRLLIDLVDYDPYQVGRNVLAELPPVIGSEEAKTCNYKRSKHRHQLYIKDNQTTPLSDPVAPGCTVSYGTVCSVCRIHIEFKILYAEDANMSSCCPTSNSPLHHFRLVTEASAIHEDALPKDAAPGELIDSMVFTCSEPNCRVSMQINISSPRISGEYEKLLTDREVIKKRKQRAVLENPDVYDAGVYVQAPSVVKVLNNLHAYLRHVASWESPREIPNKNKAYAECLGDECQIMMEHLSFTRDYETNVMVGPQLEKESVPFTQPRNMLYEDWLIELRILMDKYNPSAMPGDNILQWSPLRAEKAIRETLGCDKYLVISKRITLDMNTFEQQRFGTLGALNDFHDKLIIWAYHRQKKADPKNSPYYFECFVDICSKRKGEELDVELATARSQDEYTLSELHKAFKSLKLPLDAVDSSIIIEMFNMRVKDSPKEEHSLRENLRMIGHYLGNHAIQYEAKKTIRGIKHAYEMLGAEEQTDSLFLITLYGIKIDDNPSSKPAAMEALKLIAETRQDDGLFAYLESDPSYAQNHFMTTDMAYQRLGVEQRQISDDNIIAIYQTRVRDAPASARDFRTALTKIRDARNSQILAYFLASGRSNQEMPGSADAPVGLMNTGNSCYLNSLLQFYFTIKPLREVILNYEMYQEDEVTEDVISRKRVGGRKLSKKEIELAKKFVGKLQTLFNQMITSNASKVSPDRELEDLALQRSPEEFEGRKQSISHPLSDGMIGPQLPPHMMPDAEGDLVIVDADDITPQTTLKATNSDSSSDNTLVGDAPVEVLPPYSPPEDGFAGLEDEKPRSMDFVDHQKYEKSQIMMDFVETPRSDTTPDDKENEKPDQELIVIEGIPAEAEEDDTAPLLARAAESDEDMPELLSPGSPSKRARLTPPPTPPPSKTPPPERKPPLPPRQPTKESSRNMLESGKQQDVTECIENVMFQIEAAFKPEKLAEDGEQQDIIKRLFYGKMKQSLEVPGEAISDKYESFANLHVDVAEGDRDIYSALDSYFDAAPVIYEGKEARRYLTITELPPILQIQIQRVQFNRETKMAFKSNAVLDFPEVVFFDRYVESSDPAIQTRREEDWKWKAELTILNARRAELVLESEGLSTLEYLDTMRQYLEEVNALGDDEDGVLVEPGLLLALEQRPIAIMEELKIIHSKIADLKNRMKQQYTDLRKHGYRIYAVFIHKGSASFGHYWIYIYDFECKIYRKYNDEKVDIVPVEDEGKVFQDGEATPYFLVFVKNDGEETAGDKMMEAVKRVLGGDATALPDAEPETAEETDRIPAAKPDTVGGPDKMPVSVIELE